MPTVLFQGETAFYGSMSEVEFSQRKYSAHVMITDRRIVIELAPLQTIIVWMTNIANVAVDKTKHILKAAEDCLVIADSSANVVYRITPMPGQGLNLQEVADRIMSIARLFKATTEKGAIVTDQQWAQLHENYESQIKSMSSSVAELEEEVRRRTEETATLRKELKTAEGKIQGLEVELEAERKSKKDLLELYRKRLDAAHSSHLRSRLGAEGSEPTSADLQAVDAKRFE